MKEFLKELLAHLIEALARLATPTLERWLSRLANHLIADVPRLEGGWVVRFHDPRSDGAPEVVALDATLQQFGRRLHGVGHLQGRPADLFEFRGLIKRNVFYGSFHRKDAHILAGTGTFVLKIVADSRRLAGRCTWYDGLLDDVWQSEYVWTRNG